jgi:orotidine-5'-phosphate decarboxylase
VETPHTQLIVALDVDTLDRARDLVEQTRATVGWFKIGKQLFTRYGPESVRVVKGYGCRVFLDLKFHDIPNTVAQAVRSAGALGVDMTNVHASGGPAMLCAAAEASRESDVVLVAVTVLTSLSSRDLAAVGVDAEPGEQVVRLARLTRDCGLQGVVCSALEIPLVQEACGPDFRLVVPGIRPEGSGRGDQRRVMTPAQAAAAGAQYIVVGRPITAAEDPAAAAAAVQRELENVAQADT